MLERIRMITKEQIQKAIFVGLAAVLLVLPLPQLFLPKNDKSISMQATILMFALFYFGFLFFIEVLNKRIDREECGVAGVCILGLIFVGICSVLLSEDKSTALYGAIIRGEGLFSLLAYYFIFISAFLLKNEKYRQRLLYCFIGLGCVVSVLGLLQFMGPCEFLTRHLGMASAPMRNPNFYGAFAILFSGIGIGGFYCYDENSEITHPCTWWKRSAWYGVVLFGYIACISARSSLVYVGLAVIFLMYLFLEIVSKQRRFLSLLGLVAGLVALMLFFNIISGGVVLNELFSIGNQIQEEGTIFGDSVGSSRMMIWKKTIAILPKYWLSGCGIEQLGVAIFRDYGLINDMFIDKAHNEYLNLWMTEGIIALIFYLVFLFALFIPGLMQFIGKKKQGSEIAENRQTRKRRKKTEKNETCRRAECNEISQIAFFAFFGYIAQAFFNISVVQVAPYFWMICGLLYSRKRSKDEKTTNS